MTTFKVLGYDDFGGELVSEYRNVTAEELGALIADMLTAENSGITHVKTELED